MNVAVGQKFGRWTVIGEASSRIDANKRTVGFLACRCVCGTERDVNANNLLAGLSHGCGCVRPKPVGNPTHGMSREPEHNVWSGMRTRCLNPNDKRYRNYGGRGITICDEWRNDFARFLADMGPRPSDDHTIDRIDNDGPYAPWNCRWATKVQQANNRRGNRWIEFRGRRLTVCQWARELGISRQTLDMRFKRGWPEEKALSSGLQHRGRPPIPHIPGFLTVAEAASQARVSQATIYNLIRSGDLECLRVVQTSRGIRVAAASLAGLPRRPLGRPRKTHADVVGPRRPVGRPRKTQSAAGAAP